MQNCMKMTDPVHDDIDMSLMGHDPPLLPPMYDPPLLPPMHDPPLLSPIDFGTECASLIGVQDNPSVEHTIIRREKMKYKNCGVIGS